MLTIEKSLSCNLRIIYVNWCIDGNDKYEMKYSILCPSFMHTHMWADMNVHALLEDITGISPVHKIQVNLSIAV